MWFCARVLTGAPAQTAITGKSVGLLLPRRIAEVTARMMNCYLLKQDALPRKVHLVTSAGRTRVRFQPSGGDAGRMSPSRSATDVGRWRQAPMRWPTAVPSIPRPPSPRTSRRPAQVHSRRGCVHGSSGRTECVLRSQPPKILRARGFSGHRENAAVAGRETPRCMAKGFRGRHSPH